METKKVWTEEFTVRSYEADFQQRWKPSSIFSAMQDTGNLHADHLGWGYRDMLGRDMVWVLARIKVYFHSFPAEGERVLVRTWPRGLQQKLFFMRDFHIQTPEGSTVARASSAYVLVNPATRRMAPLESFQNSFPSLDEPGILNEALEKVPPVFNLVERLRIQAGYSSIDLLRHVNNARYADWVCDCFELEDYRDKKLEWMQINYSSEVKAGEQVAVSLGRGNQAGLWVIQGNNLSSGARSFEAAVQWGEK